MARTSRTTYLVYCIYCKRDTSQAELMRDRNSITGQWTTWCVDIKSCRERKESHEVLSL